VVPEHSVIAPGSLVAGVPGKVRRALSELEIASLANVASYYADNGRAYRAAGFGPPARSTRGLRAA
jgi:carbonic anhydrase/acetyltransferase-like protein (isoleucine patch superfamily)